MALRGFFDDLDFLLMMFSSCLKHKCFSLLTQLRVSRTETLVSGVEVPLMTAEAGWIIAVDGAEGIALTTHLPHLTCRTASHQGKHQGNKRDC